MYKIAVVEDDESYRKQISGYILDYGKEHNMEFLVSEYEDGEFFINSEGTFDIIFFDVEMPKLNGMDAARMIRNRDEYVVIVFVTNMAQYAIMGYSVGALDFILKPVNEYAFSLRLTRALERLKQKKTISIQLVNAQGRHYLDSDDIFYIESSGRNLHYYTKTGHIAVVGSMQEMEQRLTEYHFVRCNYWYLINLKYVTGIKRNMAIVGENRLEISRRNKTAFTRALTDYFGGGI